MENWHHGVFLSMDDDEGWTADQGQKFHADAS